MPLRVLFPRVLRPVAVATVGHACGFLLITQQHPPYTLRSWSKALIPLPAPVSGSMVSWPDRWELQILRLLEIDSAGSNEVSATT
jgi:hypothetical protein